MNNVKSNIWKFFIYILTIRRSYITILSIYFLTLPNTTANMIGLYTGIGNLAVFLLEIPSGYFSDRFGHKNTLILSKISMLLSSISFIFIQNLYGFIFASILLSIAIAFSSGTSSAFFHETLESLGREKEYSKLMGRIRGNVSLISMILIILLPFLTKIDILLPLIITLFLDFIGLIISFSFVNPKSKKNLNELKIKSVLEIFKEAKKLNFLPFIIFVSAISGFLIAESPFRYIYLESLGYPIILVGFVMGLSRLVWFIVGRYSYLIEKYFTMKQHLIFELFFFTIYFFLIAYFSNPYIIASIVIIGVGYLWGRSQVIESYILNNYISDKNYKATLLSIKSQVELFFQVIIPFFIGFIMNYSYKLGYYILGISLFFILLSSFLFIKNSSNKIN
ncbi:MFS transporter [bacterium]|nr:MFS transporter [bacterium]